MGSFTRISILKNLGLLIIDEEHRFGVRKKERLKRLKTNLDVLSLSATPIPRTLNMGLSGLKDISMLHEAPISRKPVSFSLLEWDPKRIREIGLFEKDRGGQVLFVHNRIQSLREVRRKIEDILPEFRVGLSSWKGDLVWKWSLS